MDNQSDLKPLERKKGENWALEIPSEHRLRSENLSFDCDVWYPRLKDFTFRTIFAPFRRKEARSIVRFYKTWNNILRDADYSEEDAIVIEELEIRLEKLIQKNFGEQGAFLRLCGRSPKDGEPINARRVLEKYNEIHQQLLKEGSPDDENTKMTAISRVPFLHVTSGEGAVHLLLSSERVYSDLIDWLDYGEPEQVVFREWSPTLRLDYEFRCFVHEDHVTAVSQYDNYGYYPHLEGQKEAILEVILKFWELVHPHVLLNTYVIDIGVEPENGHELHTRDELRPEEIRAIMIEISPFLPCTGPALFSWSGDDELLHGKKSFEFRVRTEPRPSLEHLIESNWENRWKKARGIPPYLPPEKDVLEFLQEKLSSFFSPPVVEEKKIPLFVYGTLKRGFHWNSKFMSFDTNFLGVGKTRDKMILSVGESGVPYLFLDPDHPETESSGSQILGEIWEVGSEALENLDAYEGVGKGYYQRRVVEIDNGEGTLSCQVYGLSEFDEHLMSFPKIEEYTLALHQKHYQAMRHIQVKQLKYLGMDPDAKN